jgi:hypothetical protein
MPSERIARRASPPDDDQDTTVPGDEARERRLGNVEPAHQLGSAGGALRGQGRRELPEEGGASIRKGMRVPLRIH